MGEQHILYPGEVKSLFINRILCLYCNDIVTSKSAEHSTPCKCGKTAAMGGIDFRTRVGHEGKDYEELSVWK